MARGYTDSCSVAMMCVGDPRCQFYASSEACQAVTDPPAEPEPEAPIATRPQDWTEPARTIIFGSEPGAAVRLEQHGYVSGFTPIRSTP